MNPFAAGRSPYSVEYASSGKVPVSEFVNTQRYAGSTGVAGLGSLGANGRVYIPGIKGDWIDAGESSGPNDEYTEDPGSFLLKAKAAAASVGLPTWLGPVIGVGVLGVGGYFIFKAIRKR
jgi:hypothetical protein